MKSHQQILIEIGGQESQVNSLLGSVPRREPFLLQTLTPSETIANHLDQSSDCIKAKRYIYIDRKTTTISCRDFE